METIEALIHRRSCRKYSDRPVEAEKLARIIEAGQYAPSGMGRQPVTFVAVTDPATVERLSQLNAQVMDSNSDPFYGAKTVVVVLVDRSVPTHLEDGSLAMGNLLNAAYALGVDSRCRSLHSGLCRGYASRGKAAPRQRRLRKVTQERQRG